jgi:ribosome assembly protein YihI (activator of Der GTPase)
MEVPVLILDVTEEEADKILATFDPLAAMADADAGKLESLLAEIETDSESLQDMLNELAEGAGIEVEQPEIVDPEPQIDRAAELQEQWGTERGQLWEIKSLGWVYCPKCHKLHRVPA